MDEKRRALYHRLAYEIPCACLIGIFVTAMIPRGYEGARLEAAYSWRVVIAVMILFVLVSGIVLLKLAKVKGIDVIAYLSVLFVFFVVISILFPHFP